MSAIIIIGIIYGICKAISAANAANRERRRQAEIARQRAEAERMRREWREAQARAKEETARMVALEREQIRQRKEQERMAKEQERQAAQLARHEEQLMKLEMRLSAAEGEIAFNREQRERLWKLLEIEQLERDSAIEGSKTWQKHHAKVISLENQIHTVQKRIDKAHMDKAFCEKKLEVA